MQQSYGGALYHQKQEPLPRRFLPALTVSSRLLWDLVSNSHYREYPLHTYPSLICAAEKNELKKTGLAHPTKYKEIDKAGLSGAVVSKHC